MIDFTKPLQTESGLPVRYLGVLNEDTYEESHIVSIQNNFGFDEVYEVQILDSKRWIAFRPGPKTYDIINVPVKHVYWVNFYSDDIPLHHKTKEQADNCASNDRIACVRVEFSEGYGLE